MQAWSWAPFLPFFLKSLPIQSAVSFWHSVTDVLKLWEAWGLQLRASEMYNFSNDFPVCHIAWVLHEYSISPIISLLSPLQPPFWGQRAFPFLDKQLLVLQPLNADPQTQRHVLLLIEGIHPGFAGIPESSQDQSPSLLFPPSSL